MISTIARRLSAEATAAIAARAFWAWPIAAPMARTSAGRSSCAPALQSPMMSKGSARCGTAA
jgi:hypothetical protein